MTYPLPDPRLALLVLTLVNLLWGGSLPATKLGLREFAPFLLAWLRLALSSLLFLTALGLRGDLRRLTAADWRALLGLGLLGYGAPSVCRLWAPPERPGPAPPSWARPVPSLSPSWPRSSWASAPAGRLSWASCWPSLAWPWCWAWIHATWRPTVSQAISWS